MHCRNCVAPLHRLIGHIGIWIPPIKKKIDLDSATLPCGKRMAFR